MMWVHTRSRKPESCDTIIEDTVVCEQRYSSSHATFFTSRWFVGSSRSRMSAFMRMARASASFIFQPPESATTGPLIMRSVNWKLRSVASTSAAVVPWLLITSSSRTNSTTVISCWSPWMSCSTYTVRSSSAGGNPSTWPLLIAFMSVDLPQPLGPHRP
mmetsp:Transcript_13828/g.58139  ORF Transcript_13828/g.58139 Transcript_13828/m.58139 type:complete len:159 (+) Transcript_13828:2393-2869(+)